MSKIDIYNNIKQQNSKAIEQLHLSLGRNTEGTADDRHNDKGHLTFYDSKCWDSDMKIFIHACYGYYGSSSCYAVSSPTIKDYLLKSLNKNNKLIVDDAIKLLGDDIEKARRNAKDEANEVLDQIS